MSDAIRRAIRTFIDAFIGMLALLGIPVLTELVRKISSAEPYEIDFRLWQSILIASAAAGLIAVFSFGKNWAEDNTRFPAFLKSTPSAGKNPITHDTAK